MRVTCEIDTSVPEDLAMLQRMLGEPAAAPVVAAAPAPEPEPVKEAPKPRKRAAKKPEPAPEPEPVVEEVKPEPEPEVVEAEVVAEEPSATVISMEAAISRATSLVGQGKSDTVREALNKVGVARVRELKEDDLPAFIEALG